MSEPPSNTQGRESPWNAEDFIRWSGTLALALALMVVAIIEVKGEKFHNQYVWIDVALSGAVVGCYAHVVWLIRGRRAVGERIKAVMASTLPVDADIGSSSLARRVLIASGEPVSLVEGTLFHRPECPMAAGKETVKASHLLHEAAGRTPCGVCSP